MGIPPEGMAVFGTRDVHIHADSASIQVVHERRTPEFLDVPEDADEEESERPYSALGVEPSVEEAWSPPFHEREDDSSVKGAAAPVFEATADAGAAIAEPHTPAPETVSSPIAIGSERDRLASDHVIEGGHAQEQATDLDSEPWTPAEVEGDADLPESFPTAIAPDWDDASDSDVGSSEAVLTDHGTAEHAEEGHRAPDHLDEYPREELADQQPQAEMASEPRQASSGDPEFDSAAWAPTTAEPDRAAPKSAVDTLPGEPFTPEPPAAEIPSPESTARESTTSESIAPESTASDSHAPESHAPESTASESHAPESHAPEPRAAEPRAAESLAHEADAPARAPTGPEDTPHDRSYDEPRAADPFGREQLAADPLGPPPAQGGSSSSSGGHDEEDMPLLPAFDMKLPTTSSSGTPAEGSDAIAGAPAETLQPMPPAISAPTPRSIAAQAPRPRRPINPFLANDPNQKAKRLARALISDIVTYHPDRHRQALQNGSLKQNFSEEIKKSYEEYVAQMGKDFGDSTTHFQDALNDILAAGRRIF